MGGAENQQGSSSVLWGRIQARKLLWEVRPGTCLCVIASPCVCTCGVCMHVPVPECIRGHVCVCVYACLHKYVCLCVQLPLGMVKTIKR